MVNMVLALSCLFVGVGLFSYPQLVAQAIAQGVGIWLDVLLPSLFPFMVLAGFVALTPVGKVLSLPLRPLTRMLRLSDELGAVLLVGFCGGFPTGARTLATLVEEKRITSQQASRLLGMLVNAGPAFTVTAVGERMLGSQRLGLILLGSQILASFTIGMLSISREKPVKYNNITDINYSDALVLSVKNGSEGMLAIGGYLILFSALSALLCRGIENGAVTSFITGTLEVTTGCATAAEAGGYFSVLLCAFMLGFSGLSVICQVSAICKSAGIETKGILKTRLLAGIFNVGYCVILLRLIGGEAAVFSMEEGLPVAICSTNRLLSAVCMAAMAAILFSKQAQLMTRREL